MSREALAEALAFYENAEPVSPDGPFEVLHAAATLIAAGDVRGVLDLMGVEYETCPTCNGTGRLDAVKGLMDTLMKSGAPKAILCPDCSGPSVFVVRVENPE